MDSPNWLSWPYSVKPYKAFWGAQSARDFCEEDYIITTYLAEFVNTLTSFVYVLYGYYGLRRVYRAGGDFGLCLPYIGLIGVGVCSASFHGVRQYYAQMSDDLSMLFATGAILHRAYACDKTLPYSRNLALAISTLLLLVSAYHCYYDEQIVHVIAFGGMIWTVGRRTQNLIKSRVANTEHRKRIGRIATTGAFACGLGYALWNVDMHLCDQLTALKRSIGLPWAFLLELHGWWHILTGIGAYTFMVLVEYLTTDDPAGEGMKGLGWPIGRILPSGLTNGKIDRKQKGR